MLGREVDARIVRVVTDSPQAALSSSMEDGEQVAVKAMIGTLTFFGRTNE